MYIFCEILNLFNSRITTVYLYIIYRVERTAFSYTVVRLITDQAFDVSLMLFCKLSSHSVLPLWDLLATSFDYCDIKKWSNRDLHDKIFELQNNIDKSFKDGYYVKLELYSDEQGFDQQTSVILNSIVR